MGDLTDVYAALQKADAAGDTAGAKQLADYIRSQSSAAPDASAKAPEPTYSQRVSQAGDAFNKAAGSGFWNQLGNLTGATMDVGANMLTSVPADILGAVTSAVTQNPQRGESVRNALTYQPDSASGKAAQAYVGAIASPLGNLLNRPINALEQAGHPILAQGARAAEDAVPFAAPKLLGSAARLVPKGASSLTPEATEATNAGLSLTPQQVGNAPLGQQLQGLTGSAKLERSISLKNAPKVNQLAADEIGAPDLSEASIKAAKAPALNVYKQAASAGPVPLQPQDFSGVQAPGTLVDPAVQALQNHYANMGAIDAKDLIADMRQLRADAPKNIKAPWDPAKNALGWAQKAASDGLESALGRQLQALGPNAPVALQDFQNARVQLAKVNSVVEAMKGPNVSAKILGKQVDKGAPLSGNLRVIGNAYNNFDRSFQDPARIRDSGNFGALDAPLLAVSAVKHPLLFAATLAKPVVRAGLASAPYQALGIRGGSLLAPTIRGLLNTGGALPPSAALPFLGNQQPQGLLQ